MQQFEVKSAAGTVARGACYGKWSQYHPACSDCMVWTDCQRVTERTQKEVMEKEKAELNPIEYMLGLLREKYNEERKFGDGVSAHCFRNEDGVKSIVVWVKDSGKVKMETANGALVVDKIESAKQVREIFASNDAMKGVLD